MKNVLLITAGIATLTLGVIGIFVPILPTTPFLLLSALCFLNSSKRLYRWLTRHRLFGRYIRGYFAYRAVSMRSKIVSIVFLWVVIGSTVVFFVEILWLRVLLVVIAIGVTIHIVTLRTLTKEMLEELDRAETEDSA